MVEDVERMARVCSRTTWRTTHASNLWKGDHPTGEEKKILFIVGRYLEKHFDVLAMTFPQRLRKGNKINRSRQMVCIRYSWKFIISLGCKVEVDRFILWLCNATGFKGTDGSPFHLILLYMNVISDWMLGSYVLMFIIIVSKEVLKLRRGNYT